MKYRKIPIVIEAYQTDKEFDIETLEGTMHASVGDYIVTGVNGEQYPVKPNIFNKTYDPVDEGIEITSHKTLSEILEQDYPMCNPKEIEEIARIVSNALQRKFGNPFRGIKMHKIKTCFKEESK